MPICRAKTSTSELGAPDQRGGRGVGDRWTLIVLRDIVFGDKRYFRELHAGLAVRGQEEILV
ncbi:hypothetical protein [Arthrobacter sp. V4I6]|uniref:hypothetical protein n=1 Tax=Arthrobacter sp. V4I6 TaxID=3042281 RepID=UPI0027D7C5BE|nr:hypothetical protein [Arthrobacter sp. V4I6]